MSGLLLWIAAIAIVAMLALGIAELGHAATCAAQSQTAADAAALAGAADGTSAADLIAQRNGATLVSLERTGDVFTATVQGCANPTVAHAERVETLVTIRQLE